LSYHTKDIRKFVPVLRYEKSIPFPPVLLLHKEETAATEEAVI
jgi:hypothetical protein